MVVNSNRRMELLDIIDKVSFAMDDTRLYLDTHPNCSEALKFYDKMQEKRNCAIKEYTAMFGPINSCNIELCDSWKWNKGPMPWQACYREGGMR